MIDMLVGAVEALDIGDPARLRHRHRPGHRRGCQERLEAHKLRMQQAGARSSSICPLPDDCRAGTYVTPAVYEIDDADVLEGGGVRPHPARGALPGRPPRQGDRGHQRHAATGSRSACTAASPRWRDCVAERARVGNLYVNRNQIGAVVGVQPFGGEGLSGTGTQGRRAQLSRRASPPSACAPPTSRRRVATWGCSASSPAEPSDARALSRAVGARRPQGVAANRARASRSALARP